MHTLPELPFNSKAFKDWTSDETFDRHHGKHHAGYVTKLNAALLDTDLADSELVDVIKKTRGSDQKVFNLSAQHFNHSFFWECLSEDSSEPSGNLAEAIDRDFESFNACKEQFTEAASKHFGSGWAWLVQGKDGKLKIVDTHDAETPAGTDLAPLLTLDVWEHAYYLDFKNDRGGFIDGFWNHVNWKFVASNLK